MILYHGSNVKVEKIDLSKSRPNKDFGSGFYLSIDKAQAEDMARFKALTFGGKECVTTFEFDENHLTDGQLNVKVFKEYSEEWAQFVLDNRKNSSQQNIHPFDIVFGPIADDKVGPQIRRFENGDIDMAEFLNRLKFMRGITFQYFFGTESAIELLQRL